MFNELSLFLYRLSLLESVLEANGSISLRPSDDGIDIVYRDTNGDEVFVAFYDGADLTFLKHNFFKKGATLPCKSFFALSLLVAESLGSATLEESLGLLAGGELALETPLDIVKDICEKSGVEFDYSDGKLMLYGGVVLEYDGEWSISVGTQRNTYAADILGSVNFFENVSDFFPQTCTTLPTGEVNLLDSLGVGADDGMGFGESDDFETFDAGFEEPEEEPAPAEARRKFKIATSSKGDFPDSFLKDILTPLVPFIKYVKDSEDRLVFYLLDSEKASSIECPSVDTVVFDLDGEKVKEFKVESLQDYSDAVTWVGDYVRRFYGRLGGRSGRS